MRSNPEGLIAFVIVAVVIRALFILIETVIHSC